MVTAALLPGQTHETPRSEFDSAPTVKPGRPAHGEFTNVGAIIAALDEPEEISIPEDRVYVFYPEGPEDYVMINGTRMKQFQNGRLISDIDGLSPDDLRWFQRQNRGREGEPKYIMWQGDPRGQTELYVALQPRVTAVCSKKATAANAQKIMDDVTFSLQVMLSVTSQEPRLAESWQGTAGMQRTIGALLPHVQDTLGYQEAVRAEAEQAADDEAIQEGLEQIGGAQALDQPPGTEAEPDPGTSQESSEPEPEASGGLNIRQVPADQLPEDNPFRALGAGDEPA